jgi:predicted transcriptional regulator of viral defense system
MDEEQCCGQLSYYDSMAHMQTVTELALQKAERGVFTRNQAAFWVGNSGASLDALLKRAVVAEEVWRIRRGLFCLANRYTKQKVHPFELAQRIHGPSYISLESALSHHGWTPEAVHTVTSVSLERSRAFDTPLGPFSFTRVPQTQFFAGVSRIAEQDGASFFLATPLKALADLVYVRRCDWTAAAPLVESLRIDEVELAGLTAESFDELATVYGNGRVFRFLSGLRKDLKL